MVATSIGINIKAQLLDQIASPKLNQSIMKAIMNCDKCRAFGSTHLYSLLQPITWRHPFELIAADTLSMPKGEGGYTKIGIYIDIYLAHLSWQTQISCHREDVHQILQNDLYTAPKTLMMGGGPEFDNKELQEECQRWGTKLYITPVYSPWVNGLIEGTNAKLLGILKQLYTPDMGEDKVDDMEAPYSWQSLYTPPYGPRGLHMDSIVHTESMRSPLGLS